MTDYSKLKVTELKELLSQRELPTTGKKEDLISRLTADDTAKTAKGAEEAAPAPAPEAQAAPVTAPPPVEKKEIVKDTAASAVAASETATAAPQGEKKKFTFKRIADEFEAPKPKEEEEAKPQDAQSTAPAEPAENFAAGLASSSVDSELEKRKKRAARFGVPLSDSIKSMERAKRFGADAEDTTQKNPGDKTIKALDSALGENRGKKRGPETRIQNEPPKKSKEGTASAASAKGVLSDPSEKAKAEARAKRFGGA